MLNVNLNNIYFFVQPLMPYALAFAAGAMIFVVVDSLVPSVVHSSRGDTLHASTGCMIGFILVK